jgi:hypothetical protein
MTTRLAQNKCFFTFVMYIDSGYHLSDLNKLINFEKHKGMV